MRSILFNSYNSGAATTIVGGDMLGHTEYSITNGEWVLVNDIPLSVYLDSLCIDVGDGNAGNFQRMAMLSYMGVVNFYLRCKVYRHLYVGGGDLCNLDPWNRVFPIFPGVNTLSDGVRPCLAWELPRSMIMSVFIAVCGVMLLMCSM